MEAFSISRTISIAAPAEKVWRVLTDNALIEEWLTETAVEVLGDWEEGSSFVMRGDHHGLPFENKGTVMRSEPFRVLSYSFASTVSELPDEPRNYSQITFTLSPEGDRTELHFEQRNLINRTILKHSEMYWFVTLEIIRTLAQRSV